METDVLERERELVGLVRIGVAVPTPVVDRVSREAQLRLGRDPKVERRGVGAVLHPRDVPDSDPGVRAAPRPRVGLRRLGHASLQERSREEVGRVPIVAAVLELERVHAVGLNHRHPVARVAVQVVDLGIVDVIDEHPLARQESIRAFAETILDQVILGSTVAVRPDAARPALPRDGRQLVATGGFDRHRVVESQELPAPRVQVSGVGAERTSGGIRVGVIRKVIPEGHQGVEAEPVPSDRVIEIGKAERVAELVEPCAAPSVARGVVVLAHERVEESAHLPGHEAGKAPRAPVRTRAVRIDGDS